MEALAKIDDYNKERNIYTTEITKLHQIIEDLEAKLNHYKGELEQQFSHLDRVNGLLDSCGDESLLCSRQAYEAYEALLQYEKLINLSLLEGQIVPVLLPEIIRKNPYIEALFNAKVDALDTNPAKMSVSNAAQLWKNHITSKGNLDACMHECYYTICIVCCVFELCICYIYIYLY